MGIEQNKKVFTNQRNEVQAVFYLAKDNFFYFVENKASFLEQMSKFGFVLLKSFPCRCVGFLKNSDNVTSRGNFRG